ncbi:uncharacterized protein LOC21387142 isoform X4 [Morus notabilis]|uniref:uncharacterized protein LOC21387142 isoform X4 n=1 Tax=Morus notabilis TaxID=981085 RepID=UPI000CED03B0|nr:uncharacterized protein LOC21387142 isoform X4 [Morus notabilis]
MENGQRKEKEFSPEVAELDEVLKVLDSSLSQIKWRLKASARRRLQIDVLALCTGMRPVVMVDYGGKMPELQERLCALLNSIQMMITQPEKTPLGLQLLSILKLFSSLFPVEGTENGFSSSDGKNSMANAKSPDNDGTTSQSSEFIDLSSCLQDTEVTVPTLNGWLLGYPVVYAFGKDHISDAIFNLSTKPLHIFRISICRNCSSSKGSQAEELLSFSVPFDLSMGGRDEEWAKSYLAHMQMKWERCKQTWRSLRMDVSECYPQAIVL